MRWLVSSLIAASWFANVTGGVGPDVAWRDKVQPRVLASTERVGDVGEFLVMLEERADVGFAEALDGKERKGRAVVDTLQRTAARAQAPIRRWLVERGVEHRPFWIANMILVRGSREVVEALARRPDVRRVEANPRIRLELPATEPAAPAGGSVEWNVAQVRADQVWDMGFTGEGVVVGGQDTGYDWDHPALVDAYRGWNGTAATHDHNWHDAIHLGGGVCGGDSPEPCDDGSHGTHTMGTIVGDDGASNRIGVARGARWIGCRNMDQDVGTPATYAECFEWFLAPTDSHGSNPDPSKAPHVINNSWACPHSEGCDADTLAEIVAHTVAAGIVVVASAGNSGSGCGSIATPPAIYDAAFTVGATTASDDIAGYSSRGPVTVDGSDRLKPDVSAPGSGIRSSVPNGGYGTKSGTSMAGPHVAGLVALLLDARPDLVGNVGAIETILALSATAHTASQTCGGVSGSTVPNNTYGHGRVDAVTMLLGDADGDATDNLSDCRPVSSSVWSAPEPVSDLVLAGGVATTLSWSAPADPGGTEPLTYDVLRATAADGFTAADCLASGSANASWLDDTPPATGIFYYLVRAVGPCGDALGPASDGTPRPAASCGN